MLQGIIFMRVFNGNVQYINVGQSWVTTAGDVQNFITYRMYFQDLILLYLLIFVLHTTNVQVTSNKDELFGRF